MGLCFSNYENSVYETVLQIDDEILTPPPSTFPYAPHESESESENENDYDYEVVSENVTIPVPVKPQVAYRRRWWVKPR